MLRKQSSYAVTAEKFRSVIFAVRDQEKEKERTTRKRKRFRPLAITQPTHVRALGRRVIL